MSRFNYDIKHNQRIDVQLHNLLRCCLFMVVLLLRVLKFFFLFFFVCLFVVVFVSFLGKTTFFASFCFQIGPLKHS